MIKLVGIVKHGRFEWREQLASYIASYEGQRIEIVVKKHKNARSNRQNRYKWGVVIETIRKGMLEYGNELSPEEVNQFVKEHVLKLRKNIVLPDGEVKEVVGDMKTMDTAEFEQAMERIRAYFTPFDIIIPLPTEEL